MIKKHEVGSLIRKGATSKELKEKINFPEDPSIEYFVSLGYSKNTARYYKYLLKKNNLLKVKVEPEPVYPETLLFSPNADVNNIALDTCAFKNKTMRDIIENSKTVTVIYAILREFDKVCNQASVSNELKHYIKEEEDKMLQSKGKYRLVPYNWKNTSYTDEIILDYILTLPYRERPTILTADRNFALRAECLGINYIFYREPSPSTQTKS